MTGSTRCENIQGINFLISVGAFKKVGTPSSKVTVSVPFLCSKVGFKTIVFFPVISFRDCWYDSIPNVNTSNI